MDEDKQAILDKLVECLALMRDQHDLMSLTYNKDNETVEVTWIGGSKLVNVAMDSGIAMVRDVLKAMR